ncbi:flippase [Acinetobacter sp. VNH17]|uniref:Flippase n=1 Tax=Acinetobacter thutiue TaxID=2998078 RepID=A0ABT7WSD2_9GAMM|nr:flippase [Acinetobacter thutiue]MCY6413488.1 flippase [Acinetobacter thutiue]MDN0015597.1 flippase [Acinetobacter thutiue]
MITLFSKLIDTEEKKRFITNFFSLATLQGLNYILPLLTLPYLVRVLGAEKFGLLAFATAIVGYFIVLTDYGFNFTATREISLNKENKEKLNEIFSSVMIIKSVLFFVSLIILTLLIIFFHKFNVNPWLYYLTFGSVLGQILFPVWFFQGMEQMRYITIINIISKVFFTIAIFILVKNSSDYLLVPFLTSLGTIFAGVYSLILIRKNFKIKFEIPKTNVILSYLKGGLNLFFTSVLSNLLTSSGTVILSFVSTNTVVGYYSAAEKLFRAIVGLFTPITQALYPISCRKVNQESNAKLYIKKLAIIIGGMALLVGMLVTIFSEKIITLVYGVAFQSYSYILAIMMIWLFFGVVNNIIGIQYLSASRKDKFYTSSFVVAGLVTMILNLVLIPHLFINGVLISMIVGEILLSICMLALIFRFKL